MARPGGCRPDLSPRDHAILADLRRVRLLTGRQLERLHFADLGSTQSQSSSRRRALKRLEHHHLVTVLERRVGGARAGSAGLIYTLDVAGQQLLDRSAGSNGQRLRKPWPIGLLFVRHSLDVAELYVRLREAERAGRLDLLQFQAEPASWHRTALTTLKPDAFTVYGQGELEQHVWIEVDRGTESLPTLKRKLLGYLDEAQAGDQGPEGVFPRVIVSVLTHPRQVAVQALIEQLPEPAPSLMTVERFDQLFVADARPPPTS